jgi:hypothetical protein
MLSIFARTRMAQALLAVVVIALFTSSRDSTLLAHSRVRANIN